MMVRSRPTLRKQKLAARRLTIGPSHLATEALHVMKERQLDQILVVDDRGHPAGLLDVQDLLRVGLV